MMVGSFSETDYEGNMLSASGGIQNESLELHFECVGISDNPTPETSMFLEVYVAYDNIMQLTSSGILLTN
jgi:UDP-N-acetylglucosamine 2-epimerase